MKGSILNKFSIVTILLSMMSVVFSGCAQPQERYRIVRASFPTVIEYDSVTGHAWTLALNENNGFYWNPIYFNKPKAGKR